MPSKLDKLQQIFTIVQDGVNKEEFVKAFQNVLDFIKKLEQNLINKISQICPRKIF